MENLYLYAWRPAKCYAVCRDVIILFRLVGEDEELGLHV